MAYSGPRVVGLGRRRVIFVLPGVGVIFSNLVEIETSAECAVGAMEDADFLGRVVFEVEESGGELLGCRAIDGVAPMRAVEGYCCDSF